MLTGFITERLLLMWWLLVIAVLAAYQYSIYAALERLRHRHPQKWQDLGQPHAFSANGAFYPARKFLWSQGCANLGDETLVRLARRSRRFGQTGAMLGLALVITLVAGAVAHHQ